MFRYDNKFWGAVSTIADMVVLNILFVFTSLPIITFGASVSALYAVMIRMAANEEGYMYRLYFSKFKENFKKSTIIWLIFGVIIAVICGDYYIVNNAGLTGVVRSFLLGFFMLSVLLITAICLYALVLQCRFENDVKSTIKNAVILTFAKLPFTAIMILTTLSPVLVIYFFPSTYNVWRMGVMFLWFSVVAYINSFIFNRIFKPLIEQPQGETEEKHRSESEDANQEYSELKEYEQQ